MSHTLEVALTVDNKAAFQQAVEDTENATALGTGEYTMFDGKRVQGYGVQLKGWKHPVVVDDKGDLKYDHYNGQWGTPDHLDELLHNYGCQIAQINAVDNGWMYDTNHLEDGSTEYVLTKAGGGSGGLDASVTNVS